MSTLQSWLDDLSAYEREFKKWESRVEKISKRYRDESEERRSRGMAKFNLLWSNVQTLTAATFSSLPKPEVSRLYRDSDPVGRVAALILERALDYHVRHYPEYRYSLKANVQDRFLGGRGTAWVRYEPRFKTPEQVTEDVKPQEELDYECVAVDYVHYKDFGHALARTWEEVPRVWRKVYMRRDALVERFGDIGEKVPLDADPRQGKSDRTVREELECATIYEGWDKRTREAVWFSKSMKQFLDRRSDPLRLEGVFPCPRPLYGTLTSDSLVPVPDFVIYQDQANELDILSDRIDGLIKALKVAGGYDASIPEIGRIFTEAENGSLVPVKNWAAFAEKNGLAGALSLIELKPIADALKAAYEAFLQVKNHVDELLGISDILRGQTQASETATAQNLKANYANLKLRRYQTEVAEYATGILRLMAQVICRKFSPDTLAQIAGVAQLRPGDQELAPQAMALLLGEERLADPEAEGRPESLRDFRVEVSADSLVYLDEQQERQARTEFLAAAGGYLKQVAEALAGIPREAAGILVPLLMDLLKFGVTGYRVGRTIEGAFDQAAEQLKQLALQPQQPQVPPEVQMEQLRQQAESQRNAERLQAEGQKFAMESQLNREAHAQEMQLKREQMQGDWQLEDAKHRREMAARERESQDETISNVKNAFSEHQGRVREMMLKMDHRNEMAEMQEEAGEREGNAVSAVQEEMKELGQAIQALIEQLSRPKRIIRGPDGRAAGVETVN